MLSPEPEQFPESYTQTHTYTHTQPEQEELRCGSPSIPRTSHQRRHMIGKILQPKILLFNFITKTLIFRETSLLPISTNNQEGGAMFRGPRDSPPRPWGQELSLPHAGASVPTWVSAEGKVSSECGGLGAKASGNTSNCPGSVPDNFTCVA